VNQSNKREAGEDHPISNKELVKNLQIETNHSAILPIEVPPHVKLMQVRTTTNKTSSSQARPIQQSLITPQANAIKH
jgi:hypothetical protein